MLFRRRYLISLCYLLVVTVGIVAWQNVPMEMAPDISLPSVTVSYNWGSTSPEVMEQEVTRKVEQAAYRLRDVENVRSVTLEGRTSVTIEFTKSAPIDFRIIELQESLFSLRDDLPQSLGNHRISRRVPRELDDMQAFITYSLSGPYPTSELLDFVNRNIRNPLLGHRGLADIDIQGAQDPALMVRFDSRLTDRYNINTFQVMGDIRDKLSWRSAGFTESGADRFSMMVPPALSHYEDLMQLSVAIPGSARQLSLRDIATVSVEDYPARQLRRINGSTALSISFVKEGGADALGLAEQIHADMDEVRPVLLPGMELRMELDVTEQLREQLDELQLQALVSLLCVFLVLLIFIRRFRAPFVILGSIIFSLMVSIFALYLFGFTINILTLAGLTVALGMIIDNAIVVFEQLNPGLPATRESRFGHIERELRHAVVPVLGSTLTTIGIFIPLFFTLESLQLFLVPLAVALSFTLIASVFISLTWIPYALIWLTPGGKEVRLETQAASPYQKFKRTTNRKLNRFLMRAFSIRYRMRWILYIAVAFAIGFPLFLINTPEFDTGDEPSLWQRTVMVYFDNRDKVDPWIGGISYRFANEASFRPPWGRGFGESIMVNVRPPQGSPLEEIDKIIRNFEQLGDNYSEALLYYETDVSEYTGARVRFHIDPDYLFNPLPYILHAEAAYLASQTGNVRISVSGLGDSFSTGFGGGSASFRVTLRGYSYDDLYTTARDLERRLTGSPRVEEVDINTVGWGRNDYEQYQLKLREERLIAKGLNRRQLVQAIQMDLNPTNTFGQVEFQDQNMFLIGVNNPVGRYKQDFINAPRTSGNTGFTLNEVALIDREAAMGQIRRENQSYIRTVSFNFLGPQRLGQRYLDEVLEILPLPVGTEIEDTRGFFSFQREEDRQATWVLIALALLSVWMIVSALLERWRDPIIVIMAVPLSLIGIMTGVLYTGIVFDQGAIAGTLLALGVVVNNGILLMHERERLNLAGIQGLRSWVKVYRRKMRPVLITTLTTIGGLLPLIFLGSSDFWSDLATVVVWGLSFSTIGILLLAGVWEGRGKS